MVKKIQGRVDHRWWCCRPSTIFELVAAARSAWIDYSPGGVVEDYARSLL